jgi:predicted ATP-grasp superfamily ATP-dependent carboligase
MDDSRSTLLILGASTRAAAFSARSCVLRVECGDLYGDADLRAICPVTVVADYSTGLDTVARTAPPGSWMYTGALENYPALVERIATFRPLYGNPAEVLRRVRDPFLLAAKLAAAGLPSPECVASPVGLPRDGTWLRKRKRSAGGLHVQVWQGAETHRSELARSHDSNWYFQRRIDGLGCAAVYVADRRQARLLGVTEQLVGPQFGQRAEHVPSPFCYAGSIGPLDIRPTERAVLQRIGDVLASEFKLRGLFGVDLIHCDGSFYPVEINPRYAASMEVLERHLAKSFVGWHIDACRSGTLPGASEAVAAEILTQSTAPQTLHGKAIVYARLNCSITPETTARLLAENHGHAWPLVADIPSVGTSLEVGQPVATVFAEGASRDEVAERLSERVRWCQEIVKI